MTTIERLKRELVGNVYDRGATVRVFVSLHPLQVEKAELHLLAGLSVAEMIEQAAIELRAPSLGKSLVVYIDGHAIEADKRHLVRPKAGTTIVMLTVAEAPLATAFGAVFSALSAATAGIGSFFSGLGIVGKLLGVGLAFGANMLLNALFPVRQPKLSEPDNTQGKTAYSISGSRNTATPYEPIPVILGQHRVTPVYGAQPFTESAGDEQFWRGLFVWGYGPLAVTDIKIGETPFNSFQDAQFEHAVGWPTDGELTLYSRQAYEEQLSIELEHALGWVGRTTAENINEISMDFVLPNGLFGTTKREGKRSQYTLNIGARYRLTGTENWVDLPTLSITANYVDPIRRTIAWAVPPGQYDVQARRINQDDIALETDDWILTSTTIFAAVRGFRNVRPIAFNKPLCKSAVRIRATSQLNGGLDQLNAIVTCIVPQGFNGTGWVLNAATRNPADLFRYVLQGPANARPVPDAKIDIQALEQWWMYCNAQGFTFDAVLTSATSVFDVLGDIAAAGRAVPVFKDGRYSVVWDDQDTPVVQLFTPRNSWGFESQREYYDPPHGFRVRFINRNKGYISDERLVFDDGYNEANATLYEGLEFPGVTDPNLIWRHGRFHIAQLRLRPEKTTINTDWEHLVCTRGDRVRVQHDVMLIGQISGRIKAVDAANSMVTLDESVIVEAGKTYAMRFRASDGTIVLRDVPIVTTDEVTAVTLGGAGPLPAVGDLFSFGETSRETAVYRVLSIEPNEDLTARITLVDDAPAISQADRGAIPPFNSNVSAPPDPFKLPPVNLTVSQEAYERSGEWVARIFLTWQVPRSGKVERYEVQMQDRSVADQPWIAMVNSPAEQTSATIERVYSGVYRFRVRAIFTDGTWSSWVESPDISTTSLLEPPADVTGFHVAVLGEVSTLSWDAVPLAAYYEIRFVPDSTATVSWNTATPLIPQASGTSAQVPTMVGSYMIKAVRGNGIRSRNATLIRTNVAGLIGQNVVEVLDETGFPGVRDDTEIVGGSLQLLTRNVLSNWTLLSEIPNMADGELGAGATVESEGFYYFDEDIDLGQVYTSRLTATIDAEGSDLTTVISYWSSLDTVARMDNSDPEDWSVQLQYRTTDVDPSLDDWSGWQAFIVGDVTARAFQFRLRLSGVVEGLNNFSNVTPVVHGVSVSIDMPDRVVAGEDIIVPTAGIRIDFDNAFIALKGLAIAAQDMATGDYSAITAKDETGFDIRFFNSANAPVSRTFDYVAKGYGFQQ